MLTNPKIAPPSVSDIVAREEPSMRAREVIRLAPGVFYPCGAVLGRIASTGIYTLASPTASDGSEVARAVLMTHSPARENVVQAIAFTGAGVTLKTVRLCYADDVETDAARRALLVPLETAGIGFVSPTGLTGIGGDLIGIYSLTTAPLAPLSIAPAFTLSPIVSGARITVAGPIDPQADRIVYRIAGVDRTLVMPAATGVYDVTEGFTPGQQVAVEVVFARAGAYGPSDGAVNVTPITGVAPTYVTPPSISGSALDGQVITYTSGVATGTPAPTKTSAFLNRQYGPTGAVETVPGSTPVGKLRAAGYRYRIRESWSNGAMPNLSFAGDWSAITAPVVEGVLFAGAVAGGAATVTVQAPGATSVSVTVAGVTGTLTGAPGTAITFTAPAAGNRAYSVTATVFGAVSPTVTGTLVVAAPSATVPAAFMDAMATITAHSAGGGYDVNITSLPADGGSALTRVDIQTSGDGGTTWSSVVVLDDTAPFIGTTAVTGVAPGAYQVRLVAVNAVGAADPALSFAESVTVTPPATPFYPALAPVSLTEATGAVAFPEYNGRNVPSASGDPLPQAINNPRAVIGHGAFPQFPASSVASQVIAIASLPKKKRSNSVPARGIVGNSTRQTNGYPGTTANQFCLYMQQDGRLACKHPAVSASIVMPSGTETPDQFVLAYTNVPGTGQTLSQTEVGTGVQVVTTPINTSYAAFTDATGWNIANIGKCTSSNIDGTAPQAAWPDVIEAVYILSGATVSQEVIAQLARGEVRPQDVLPIGNLIIAEEMTPVGAVTPAWASSAINAQPVKLGATPLRPSSPILRRQAAAYGRPLQTLAGRVYALLPGVMQRAIPFRLTASGAAEVQVYDLADGTVVRDWTALSSYAGGIASGDITLPRGDHGWYGWRWRVIAAPTVGGHGPFFGVGYKVIALGQSQVAYGLGGTTYGWALPAEANVSTVFGTSQAVNHALVGGNERGDSLVAFAATWSRLMGRIPVEVHQAAVPGTGIGEMLYDDLATQRMMYGSNHSPARSWATEQAKIDAFGATYTAVAWTWYTNDSGAELTPFRQRIDALLYGVQGSTLPAPIQHSYAGALEPGYAVIHMPAIRGGDINEYAEAMYPWAQSKGQTMAAPAIDMVTRTKEPGHASGTQAVGPSRFGKALAFGLARAVNEAVPHNPYLTNARITAPNVIAVDFVSAVSGDLVLQGPSDGTTIKHAWGWKAPEAANWTYSDPNVIQTKSGNSIVLTKTDGNWPEGVLLTFSASGAVTNSSATVTSAEWAADQLAAAAGLPYEAWPADPLGVGIPIVGGMVAGAWSPIYEVAPPVVTVTEPVFATATPSLLRGLETWITTPGNVGRDANRPLKAPGIAPFPSGMAFKSNSPTTIVLRAPLLAGAIIEDWDFRGYTLEYIFEGVNIGGFSHCLGGPGTWAALTSTQANAGYRIGRIERCNVVGDNTTNIKGFLAAEVLEFHRCKVTDLIVDAFAGRMGKFRYCWINFTNAEGYINAWPIWDAGATYANGQIVARDATRRKFYRSRVSGNIGNALPPDETDNAFWYGSKGSNPHLDAFHLGGTVDGMNDPAIEYCVVDMRQKGGYLLGNNAQFALYNVGSTGIANLWPTTLRIAKNVLYQGGGANFMFANARGMAGDVEVEGIKPCPIILEQNLIYPNQYRSIVVRAENSINAAWVATDIKWGQSWWGDDDSVIPKPANVAAL